MSICILSPFLLLLQVNIIAHNITLMILERADKSANIRRHVYPKNSKTICVLRNFWTGACAHPLLMTMTSLRKISLTGYSSKRSH